jgi:MFS family permease
VAGVGNGAEVVGNDTLLQQYVDRRFQGRIFGLLATAAVAGNTFAAGVGGVLLDATSARTVFVIAGVGTLVVFVATLVFLPRAARRAPQYPE